MRAALVLTSQLSGVDICTIKEVTNKDCFPAPQQPIAMADDVASFRIFVSSEHNIQSSFQLLCSSSEITFV